VEGMLNAQQLTINQYVIVSLVTMEIHMLVATELNAMKMKTVQMIKYVKITYVKYHVWPTTRVVQMLCAPQKITNKYAIYYK